MTLGLPCAMHCCDQLFYLYISVVLQLIPDQESIKFTLVIAGLHDRYQFTRQLPVSTTRGNVNYQ